MNNLTKKQAKEYCNHLYDGGIRFSMRDGKDDRSLVLHMDNLLWIVARVSKEYALAKKFTKQETEFFLQNLFLDFEFYSHIASIVGYGIEVLQKSSCGQEHIVVQ